ncbi:MAG: hypothetical protein HOH82_13085 [Planctomycetaceae bacterium]|nr:hypothetical protein [Planctomycetaceae bacterium]
MNADLRCFSVVVLLLALMGCGSDSDPPQEVENKPTEKAETFDWEVEDNLEMLTEHRRIQKKPDPLKIVVSSPDDLTANITPLPTFDVALVSADVEKTPLWITEGGDYRSTRLARWRFEVKDEEGHILPQRESPSVIGGGMYTCGFLLHGEKWETSLPMGDYVDIPKPGQYTVRILYHDSVTIADITDKNALEDLIVFASEPFQLTLAKRPIQLRENSRQRTRLLIEKLDETEMVKIIRSGYSEDYYKFIVPGSPQGELLTMGWQAVPQLIDALRDNELSARKRVHLFSLLHGITLDQSLDVENFEYGVAYPRSLYHPQ